MFQIEEISLPVPGLKDLQLEAVAEGYEFIERLVREWESGANRFDGLGETLCGHLESGMLVAVGGLNCDPFAGRPDVGRIRRVYVRSAWRGKGIGTALVTALVSESRRHFSSVRLRAVNADAARLYESLGFVPIEDTSATHMLRFDRQSSNP